MGGTAAKEKVPEVAPVTEAGLPPERVKELTNDELYFDLSRKTNFQRYQVRRLHSSFRKLAQGQTALTESVFVSQLVSTETKLNPQLGHAWFVAFDQNKDGFVDFNEFVSSIAVCLLGKTDERASLLFSVHDLDGDGVLSPEEVQLLQRVASLFSLDLSLLSGSITRASFIEAAHKLQLVADPIFTSFHLLPSVKQERDIIRRLIHDNPMSQEGQTWYLISFRWWDEWREYVMFDATEDSDDDELVIVKKPGSTPPDSPLPDASPPSRPGRIKRSASTLAKLRPVAIDNSELQGETFDGELRAGLVDDEDFVPLPAAAWEQLHDWYGGGPAYPRHVVGFGIKKLLRIELYPYFITFIKVNEMGDPSSHVSVPISSQCRQKDLYPVALKALKLPQQDTRLWLREPTKPSMLATEDDEKTLEELELKSGDLVMVETRNPTPDEAEAAKNAASLNDGTSSAGSSAGPATVAGDSAKAAKQLEKEKKKAAKAEKERLKQAEKERKKQEKALAKAKKATLKAGDMAAATALAANGTNGVPESNGPSAVPSANSSAESSVSLNGANVAAPSPSLDPSSVSPAAPPAPVIFTGKWPMDMRIPSKEWRNFQLGDFIDAKDTVGKWYRARIEKINGQQIFIHFEGWVRRWDEWLSADNICVCTAMCSCQHRIAPVGTQSRYTEKKNTDVAYEQREQNQEGPAHRGVAGLFNLGNTCFMNSTLQCLSNTPLCTPFFTSGRYAVDINKDNPLGNGGKLAVEFANLLKQLWSGQYTAVAPRSFKKAIGEFAPQFSGFQQHDSQELLAYLLDGIHEDLNRVRKKPQTQAVESDGRPDEEVAALAWETHLKRNQSIIVDLFMGQLKSTVVCPHDECKKESITFDPFMYLPVPLPQVTTRRLNVVVIRADASPPVTFGVEVDRNSDMSHVRKALEQLSGCPWYSLIVCDYYKSKIYKVVSDDKPVSMIRPSDTLVAYEWTADPLGTGAILQDKDSVFIQVVHKTLIVNSHGKRLAGERFGMPLVLRISPATTNRRLHDILHKQLSAWVPANKLRTDPPLYNVHYSDLANERCGRCHPDSGCGGCVVPNDDNPCRLHERYSLLVIWDNRDPEALEAIRAAADPSTVIRHPSCAQVDTPQEESVTLFDCIRKFSSVEVLGKDDAWYCPRCKEFRQATKKLDIFKCPEILIVQIKRFVQVSRHHRDKLGTLVQFPIKGLDLSPFLSAHLLPENKPLYDLFAVSNHHGSCHAGHYTAFARNFENNKWYNFDDSRVQEINVNRVVTSAAYVLFYKRRS